MSPQTSIQIHPETCSDPHRYCHCVGSLVRCIKASVLCIVHAGHVLHKMYRLSGEGGKVPSAGQHRCRTGNGVVTAGVSAPVSHLLSTLLPALLLPFVHPPPHLSSLPPSSHPYSLPSFCSSLTPPTCTPPLPRALIHSSFLLFMASSPHSLCLKLQIHCSSCRVSQHPSAPPP